MNAFFAAALLLGQPATEYPIIEQPEYPKLIIQTPAFPHYNDADKSGPLVTFVNCEPRKVNGASVCTSGGIPEWPAKCIVVSVSGQKMATLPANATDAQIREAVQPTAPFFEPSSRKDVRQTADGDPWLAREASDKVKAMWPKGVPLSSNLKFYFLEPRYQALTTTGGGSVEVRQITPIAHEESHPFLVSGGMAHINSSLWRSTKGLDIPAGKKIAVWEEPTDVRAFALVHRYRWKFPVGTVAYDVLSNNEGGIFEIRTQERTEEGWETHIMHKDISLAPSGYQGAGQSCASCHNSAGAIMDVPGRIYRRERWGSDGRFSWRPYDESNRLDNRWPIERK